MILVDTSAWIEFLRATDSAQHLVLRDPLAEEARLVTSEPVVMGLLAGAAIEPERDRLRALVLGRCRLIGVESAAIRASAEVLHRDRDLDVLVRNAPAQPRRPGVACPRWPPRLGS